MKDPNTTDSVATLVERLRACFEDPMWADHAEVPKALLREAAEELHNLAWALSLPGFDRMATDEQEAEHQAGVQRIDSILERMAAAKAEHDAAMADAARFRWIDEQASTVDMESDSDNLVWIWHRRGASSAATTARTLREAVDAAMAAKE